MGAVRDSAEREGRKALARLRRSIEKSGKELEALSGAIRAAEGEDFPEADYEIARGRLEDIVAFLDEEGRRLEAKILHSGGLEPGRIRRTSS